MAASSMQSTRQTHMEERTTSPVVLLRQSVHVTVSSFPTPSVTCNVENGTSLFGHICGDTHWGRGGLETNENILSTLQALVESTCHLPTDNRLGTFQMFLQVPGQTHDVGIFMEHFECNINMCNTFDPP